mmetsp:Transcript_9297/g.14112  ORF Transcript_9297/g.14112 Transcript_9297/m.14112 type:complete len:431 (-) Transcript_9297:21-1313(-)
MILPGSLRLHSVADRYRRRIPIHARPTTLFAFSANRPYASSATESRSMSLEDRSMFHFLSYCEESKLLPTKGVPSKGLMKYLQKNCGEKATALLKAISVSPHFSSGQKSTSTVKLSTALEFIGDSDRFPVQVRCQIIEKMGEIESFATSISKEGITVKELVDGLSKILSPSPSVPKEKLVHFYTNELTHLWVYDTRSARFYSVNEKLVDIARKHSHREISQRALQALIQIHFPMAWGTLHPLHALPRLSNYSIIPQKKTERVSLIDWISVFDKVDTCLEEQFQESVAKCPNGTVLSRVIPLSCFQNVLREIIPNYPVNMPHEFSLESHIRRHFSNRYSLSIDGENTLEIQPKGVKDPSWFEGKAKAAIRENTASSSESWVEFESVVKTIEKSERSSIRPSEMGAKSWTDLIRATPQLEYYVKIFVREKRL